MAKKNPNSPTDETPTMCAGKPCPCTTPTVVAIMSPMGSLDKNPVPVSSWMGEPDNRFDFQGVERDCNEPYAINIIGNIHAIPPYSYKWTLEAAAGYLSNDTIPTPNHSPPVTEGEGVLTLMAMEGTLRCHSDTRKIKIYQDHLARDYDNFGVGIRTQGKWKFTKYGVTIWMANVWNCHGGSYHIAVGKTAAGSGNCSSGNMQALLDSYTIKKEVQVTHGELGNGTHPPLGPLKRGDIVAYYAATGKSMADRLMHTQTCTGNGTETYGANNEPLTFPGNSECQSWKWAISPAGDWANHVQLNLGASIGFPITPVTIRVYRRP